VDDLAIRGATVIANGAVPRDLLISGGRVTALAEPGAGTARAEIDAAGLYALPGIVDAHVHFNEPGRTDWEGWEHGSRAAAAGGTTTTRPRRLLRSFEVIFRPPARVKTTSCPRCSPGPRSTSLPPGATWCGSLKHFWAGTQPALAIRSGAAARVKRRPGLMLETGNRPATVLVHELADGVDDDAARTVPQDLQGGRRPAADVGPTVRVQVGVENRVAGRWAKVVGAPRVGAGVVKAGDATLLGGVEDGVKDGVVGHLDGASGQDGHLQAGWGCCAGQEWRLAHRQRDGEETRRQDAGTSDQLLRQISARLRNAAGGGHGNPRKGWGEKQFGCRSLVPVRTGGRGMPRGRKLAPPAPWLEIGEVSRA